MTKTVTIRMDEADYEVFSAAAKADNRSLSNFITTAAKAHLLESAFVDDEEMAEILADEALMKQLEEGTRDALEGRSTPVE